MSRVHIRRIILCSHTYVRVRVLSDAVEGKRGREWKRGRRSTRMTRKLDNVRHSL